VKRLNSESGYLLLEDGARFDGEVFLGEAPSLGEAVFNTSHSGYQEILSDPSYRRQIMVFTVPHVGNVGVNAEDMESERVQAAGAVMRSLAPAARSWRAEGDLQTWLGEAGVALLVGADTRAVTLHLRGRGAMRSGLLNDPGIGRGGRGTRAGAFLTVHGRRRPGLRGFLRCPVVEDGRRLPLDLVGEVSLG